jgi:SOS response regulatory protein OraA/RecX
LHEALDFIARAVAVRDHSRLELQQKLSTKFSPDVVTEAMARAEASRWLAPETEIAERAALTFERKLKSRAYIENQLQKRGLPLPPRDVQAERQSARNLVEKKYGPVEDLSFESRAQASRYLIYRGFDESTIRTVLNDPES